VRQHEAALDGEENMPESRDETVDAFMATYFRYAPKMHRVAIRNFGVSSADAVEIIQSIFVVYRMHIDEVENIEAYLLGSLCDVARRHVAPPDAEVPWTCGETPCLARREPPPR
jgi:hypothetical protein